MCLLAEPALGTEAERFVRGARLRAGAEQYVSGDDRPMLGEPVDELGGACGLKRLDPAGELIAGAERMRHLDAAVSQRLRGTGRRPDVAGFELTARAPVPVDGHEHVRRRAELDGRVDRIDEDEAVARFHRERADVLFPVIVPRRPTVQPGCDLLHRVIFP